jgi:hypothetical protein
MIVDDALTAGEYLILQAVLDGDLDEHTDLPDAVVAALHRDDSMEKAGNADHLKRYWAHGAGAKKIGWGSKGDFARCVAAVGQHMDDPEGYCNLRHKEATGEYPGQHAARERGKSKAHKAFRVVEKFNRNHDRLGRFATAPGAGAAMHTEAPEFDSWDEDLQQEYQAVVADSTHGVEGLMLAAEAHGYSVGMSPDDAATYSAGVARRALSASIRRESEGSIDFDRRSYSKKVDEWRAEGRPTIAVHEDSAQRILNEGRVKSQFETGQSNGMFAPKERAAAEVEMFNHSPDLPPNRRTVYGFVAMPGLESQRSVDQYGPVRLVLKDDVKARTTMTVGDSLSTHAMPIPMIGKVTAAQKYDAAAIQDGGYLRYQAGAFTHERFSRARYAEAQIHGGVSVKDIAEVHLPESFIPKAGKPWHPIVQAAYDLGIPTVWYDSKGDPQRTRRVGKAPVTKAAPYATRPDGGVLYATGEGAAFGDIMVQAVIDGVTYEPAPLQAVIAKDPTWEKVVTKAIRVMEKHLPGQHNQQSHAGGRIGTHTGMRVGETKDDEKAQAKLLDDPTTMANLPQEYQDRMIASAAEIGATPESLEANIEATLQRAGGPTGPGHDWYEQANRECARVATDTGIPLEQAVGAVAAISPQQAWGSNLAVARFLAENKNQPVDVSILSQMDTRKVKDKATGKMVNATKTRYEWVQIEAGRNMDKARHEVPPIGALAGKRFSDLDPYVAASLMKAHAQAGVGMFEGKRLTGPLSIIDDVSGKAMKVNFPGTIQTGRGLRVIQGEDANGIINGHKVRSFRNNMLNPTDPHGDITVDSHAVSLAIGRKISSSSPEYAQFTGGRTPGSTLTPGPSSLTLGIGGNYALWADAYRRVAKRHGIRPNQLQSITWIQWRKEHPDNASAKTSMDKAEWPAW